MKEQADYEAVIAELIEQARQYLKRHPFGEDVVPAEARIPDEKKGVAAPPLEHSIPQNALTVDLPRFEEIGAGTMPLRDVLQQRRSRRAFSDEPLALEELAFLCWSVAGIRKIGPDERWAKRTSPSSGARHPFETYAIVERVQGVEPGLYRYSGLPHELVQVRTGAGICADLAGSALQQFVADSAVLFVWTAVPYRSEWRYMFAGSKLTAIDIGHYCENLYLAAESIGAGACALSSYDQQALDACLGVDGHDEFTIYLAAVGRLADSLANW